MVPLPLAPRIPIFSVMTKNPLPFWQQVSWWLGLLGCLLVPACAVGPRYQRPTSIQPERFGQTGGPGSRLDAAEQDWWRSFQDSRLERLIQTASTNNHDLRLAQSRLAEARALWTQARFDFYPTMRSQEYYENSQTSRATQADRDRGGRHNELYRAGFDATWELDLWGKVRRSVEAARATVAAVEATRDEVLITVRAEVAVNYLELRGLQAQLAVSQRNATNQTETLVLAEALRDGGQGTQFDVARARSLLNATLAAIPPLESALQRVKHRLAVLCGLAPGALLAELAEPQNLPVTPTSIAIGTPADLLRRRPDIRAAERALAAATARVGVEMADLFPSVTFVGSLGLQANRLGGLGDAGTEAWGFGPHLSWAALDLGRVRQRIRAAGARAEAALTVYEHTVLLALEETENALNALDQQRRRLGFLRESERAAAGAVALARQRYRDGIADFLSVLDAERTLLSLQDQLVSSETLLATRLVAVYKSLAGSPSAGEATSGAR